MEKGRSLQRSRRDLVEGQNLWRRGRDLEDGVEPEKWEGPGRGAEPVGEGEGLGGGAEPAEEEGLGGGAEPAEKQKDLVEGQNLWRRGRDLEEGWSLRSGRDLEEGRSLWRRGRDLDEGVEPEKWEGLGGGVGPVEK